MYNLQWSRANLTPQKVGAFCEYYAKMALISYGVNVSKRNLPELEQYRLENMLSIF